MTAQEWCDVRNAALTGSELEWFVSATGDPTLRYRADWQMRHTAQIQARAEQYRRQFNHRATYPVTATGGRSE